LIMKIAMVASEMAPLIKTGGLADVCGSLPWALLPQAEVVFFLPAYPQVLAQVPIEKRLPVKIAQARGEVAILTSHWQGLPLYLIDAPLYFNRAGDPYRCLSQGVDWQDNAERFWLFAQAVMHGLRSLSVDVVHCHDWQSGLLPALLAVSDDNRPTVFSIHNLAYQGNFPQSTFQRLGLPKSLWHLNGVEFYGQLSFLKAGLAYSTVLHTVSPSYAEEIQGKALGMGMDGLLRARKDRLFGILNGIDDTLWNPESDPFLNQHFSWQDLRGKAALKAELQDYFHLEAAPRRPLLVHIGRLVSQKGLDLVLSIARVLLKEGVQLAILGSGETALEQTLQQLAQEFPAQMGVYIGFDEKLAHLLEAGGDIFLMPSRFEPCGLNQLYSQRYGTLPVVHAVGGLRDSVVPVSPETLANGSASGFMFYQAEPWALLAAIQEALHYYQQPELWQQLQRQAMQKDFSWRGKSSHYLGLYQHALALFRS
jgi:starch synthase